MLVVEPHKGLRESLKNTLGRNFRVLAAQSGSGAVAGFQHHEPGVVLIAMKQDEGHGLDLCRKIRDLKGGGRAMTIVYGALPDGLPDDVAESDIRKQYGVDRYIPRGVTLRRLEELVEERLRLGWRPIRQPQVRTSVPGQRFANPLANSDVISAKNTAQSEPGFRLSRFFRRRR